MKHVVLLFVLLMSAVHATSLHAHPEIPASEAHAMIVAGDDAIVLDVREPSEFCGESQHIPDAVTLPWNSGVLQDRFTELPTDRTIIVVCAAGMRSHKAADFLESKGFTSVYDVADGMKAWNWKTESCAAGPAVEESNRGATLETAIARAERASQALGSDLMQRLMAELQSGGPAEAVRVCSVVAQNMAAGHSTDGLTVRRVSLKARNPADRPDEFEREALGQLEKSHLQGQLPPSLTAIVESEEGRQLRYLRPITIVPLCLSCHGPADAIDSEVAAEIAERYPDDEATGYAGGDLRGAISVTVPLD